MNRNIYHFLKEITGKGKIYILILVLLQIFLGISGVLNAYFLREVIDCAVGGDNVNFIKNLCFFIGIILLIIISLAIGRFVEEYARSGFENSLKERLFQVLMYREYEKVTDVHSGEWMNRLTNDTVVVADGLATILPGISRMVVQLIGAIIMLLWIEPQFGFIFLPCGGILIVLTTLFRKVLKKLHKRVQEADGKVRIFMQEHLESLAIVKVFVQEEKTVSQAREKMEKHRRERMKRNHFSNFCNVGFNSVMQGAYVIGLVYSGYGIINHTISYGTIMAILQLVSQIQTPFANITGYLPRFYAMNASAERLLEAESDEEIKDILAKEEIEEIYNNKFQAIKITDGEFSYGENEPKVFSNLNLEIKKGDYIAFTGKSGCGKSTIMKLLMNLYKFSSGECFLELEDDRVKLNVKYRRFFSFVPQGNMLMSGTIRQVVSFANPQEVNNDEKIKEALKISCAWEFVEKLKNGLETRLLEHGMGLSEGQMQRIAIARAIFAEAPILLLDEATSALDEKTEEKLLKNIKEMTNKTVLIVTHRPAALEICNQIIKM